MQNKKVQFYTDEEIEQIVQENSHLNFLEIQYLLDGNFLIFRDYDIPIEPVFIEGDLKALELENELLKSRLQTIEDALLFLMDMENGGM